VSSSQRALARPLTLALIALVVLLLAGCSAQEDTPLTPATHAIRGRVRLTGNLTRANGDVIGERSVEDADGVPVELVAGTTVVARAVSVDGGYRFDGVAPGSYLVRTTVVNRVTARTDVMIVRYADVVAGDTLLLVSDGDLDHGPNPFAAAVTFRYSVFQRAPARLRILTPAGGVVRVLADSVMDVGDHVAVWDGTDSTGGAASGTVYWATFESGIDQRAQLLFR
jgi:hypothetical protein